MRELPIILLGMGGVARALVRQIVASRGLHAAEYGLHLPFLALCDSDGAVVALERGLDDANLLDLVAHKAAGERLADHALGGPQADLRAIIDIAGWPGAVVVDCTATAQTIPALLYALDKKYRVVLANKKPLTDTLEVYDRLARAGVTQDDARDALPSRQLSRTRWETTCGAGLPVIVTLNRLVASGDKVQRILGAFSGTLGYVMTGLQAGRPFSAVVREAYDRGYTEPDPRDDLGGVDVARKALILARGIGWRLDMDAVQVRGLYPAAMDSLSVPEFLTALPELDTEFRDRVDAAAADGKVLRFAATLEDGHLRVGPTAVAADTPLGRLQGADNLVEFYTRWYNPEPLVVQGRGAGVDATAAGVLSDIVELAFTE